MINDQHIPCMGPRKLPSPLVKSLGNDTNIQFIGDDERILFEACINDNNDNPKNAGSFEKAGPREHIYFEPSKVRAGIVTCGGLCPGINNVIRTLVMHMHYHYGVTSIFGFKYGYQGFIPKYNHELINLTPNAVKDIHNQGGSFLHSSRGHQDISEIVDSLERNNINILFCTGGDGTLRGAHYIWEEIKNRNLKISIVGIPKTIDNDVPFCARTFGFETAFSKAIESIQGGHVEARGFPYGIVIVKLMGRDSGFIAANTTLACPDVNFVLVPEVPFTLEGEQGLLKALHRSILEKEKSGRHPHAVIVVAEGAGQDLMHNDGSERDASGNVKYKDIGLFLRKQINAYFKDKLPINLKYIEPSYLIRSVPANAHDSIFCYYLAENAVHAAMAGKTDLMIGYWNDHFTHVPLSMAINERKKIDPNSAFWRQVLACTGQPARMK
ncbi:diphosphate--fructose-6-phosphate 1-phosphotransferase [candidate division KSB3 bacterium]|uniref:ATP-dependent 6-phosphofructokinase n=1 Tax=candidate division KSB3 bacterium TaxID=2044937 RepID=A0A2G6KNI4_9BACT|nr:MAG: diphosphate--fructose-6-phosphate 1-phosphotransferase [candidate division KSB3 bacterium]